MGMTASNALAEFAVTAQPDPSLAGIVTRAVADCFGCILAGTDSDVARRARAAFSLVGSGSSPVFGTSETLPASLAALVNAVAGHAWELDDWEEPGNTHPTVILLPALLAAAHLRPASGARLLAAYSVGTEIIMRLGVAVSLEHYTRGFHTTATLGTIGVAGAVARLLSLTPLQTTHAHCRSRHRRQPDTPSSSEPMPSRCRRGSLRAQASRRRVSRPAERRGSRRSSTIHAVLRD